ncbi:MAG: DUF721 domain-containing protein [Bacteroidales bacterium]|nr:DUF721 domain-containing protein [Bacteroidales bacterium]
MKRTNSRLIGEILDTFFEENPKMADKLAETRLMDYWNSMSPMISRYTTDLYIRNKVLYVKVNSSILKNELLLGKDNLIKKLNEEAGRTVIEDITVSS